jgi:hypothetical protein
MWNAAKAEAATKREEAKTQQGASSSIKNSNFE